MAFKIEDVYSASSYFINGTAIDYLGFPGVNKYQTVIGDGAFIGSGTQLVAPVEVGEGATIGAGSTITKPVPEGQLSLERSKQNSPV